MIKEKVIGHSHSEFVSLVLRVLKPDASMRFIVYYRRLNNLMVKYTSPLLVMDEYFVSLGEARWFQTFDANCDYWKVEIPKKY